MRLPGNEDTGGKVGTNVSVGDGAMVSVGGGVGLGVLVEVGSGVLLTGRGWNGVEVMVA